MGTIIMVEKLNLTLLLGKELSDPAVRSLLASFGEVPTITDFSDHSPHDVFRSFRNSGISIKLEGPRKILTCIFLYAEGESGFRQFKGELLGGVRFGDQISTMTELLGSPKFSNDLKANRVPGARKESSRGYVVDSVNYSFLFDETDKLVRASLFLHAFRLRKLLSS